MNEDSIAELKRSLRGALIQPGDADYDEARKVYNGMIHKKPRLIARCADVADVIGCVNFARDNNLLVSIRGGGHNAGGLGICDDGLVIDLAPIKYTRVDRMQPEREGCDDAKIAAAAAKRPEQIRIFVGARFYKFAVGQDQIGREQIVDAQSAFSGEMTDAAA